MSTTRIDIPCPAISLSACQIFCRTSGASPSVASSRISSLGLVISARPMANICCSPPESRLPIEPTRVSSSGNSAKTFSTVQGSGVFRWLLAVATRFSIIVRLGKICRPSGTRPRPRLAVLKLGRPTSSCPSKVIEPPLGLTIPMIELTVVVFPMPLRPSSVATCPASNLRLTPNRAWLEP